MLPLTLRVRRAQGERDVGACGSMMWVAWASDPGLPAYEAGTSIPWIRLRQPGQTGLGGQGCALGSHCSCWPCVMGPACHLPAPCLPPAHTPLPSGHLLWPGTAPGQGSACAWAGCRPGQLVPGRRGAALREFSEARQPLHPCAWFMEPSPGSLGLLLDPWASPFGPLP